MGRLSSGGTTQFVIIESDPIYSDSELDRICARHDIASTHRSALKRVLEEAGQIYLDQMQLNGRPTQTIRLRQDLRKGLCLLTELIELVPDLREPGQSGADSAHAAALREGDRQVKAAATSSLALLADAPSTLSYLRDVYELALESAARGARGARGAPERARTVDRWRSPIIEFYTLTLGRTWMDTGTEHDGERFVRDCLSVLEEGAESEEAVIATAEAAS
ncbi:hypothetical protein [Oceanicaulis alexandrii]|uniref:hypothetical protein n=1 Tax=Oceanicaulis alexandrii TaxID=153233 RepID=UPI003BAE7C8E